MPLTTHHIIKINAEEIKNQVKQTLHSYPITSK